MKNADHAIPSEDLEEWSGSGSGSGSGEEPEDVFTAENEEDLLNDNGDIIPTTTESSGEL